MSDTKATLWAARLHLNSGKPATLLDTETIRAICEAYVKLHDDYEAITSPSLSPFLARFIPKHAADCRDLNCDRSCMVTKVTP